MSVIETSPAGYGPIAMYVKPVISVGSTTSSNLHRATFLRPRTDDTKPNSSITFVRGTRTDTSWILLSSSGDATKTAPQHLDNISSIACIVRSPGSKISTHNTPLMSSMEERNSAMAFAIGRDSLADAMKTSRIISVPRFASYSNRRVALSQYATEFLPYRISRCQPEERADRNLRSPCESVTYAVSKTPRRRR